MQQQPGYPATQQPPAMHDQIHRVGAAPRGRRAAPRCPPIALPAHRGRREHDAAPRGRLARVRRETRAGRRSERRCASGPRARALPARRDWRRCPRLLRERGGRTPRSTLPYAPGSFYDGAPPVAGVIGAHAPGGMVRMERNSQGSLGGSGGSGGGGLDGGGGSVVAISGLVHRGPYGFGSHEFLVGSRGTRPRAARTARTRARRAQRVVGAAGPQRRDPRHRGEHGARHEGARGDAGALPQETQGAALQEEDLARFAARFADNRVRIKGRFARADAPLVTIDKSSAKNHPDIKGDTREEAEEGAVPDNGRGGTQRQATRIRNRRRRTTSPRPSESARAAACTRSRKDSRKARRHI